MSVSMSRGIKFGAVLLSVIASGQVGAADGTVYGLGAGASSNGVEIYAPVRMGSLIVEPRIAYYRFVDKTDRSGKDITHYPPSDSLPDESVAISSWDDYSRKSMEIGLGVFAISRITDEIEYYVGGRLGYLTAEQMYDQRNDYAAGNGFVNTSSYRTDREQTGYFLAPTIGVQYFPRSNFSLGIEVTFRYSSLSGHENKTRTSSSNNPSSSSYSSTESGDADSIDYRTVTSAVIRGYF